MPFPDRAAQTSQAGAKTARKSTKTHKHQHQLVINDADEEETTFDGDVAAIHEENRCQEEEAG